MLYLMWYLYDYNTPHNGGYNNVFVRKFKVLYQILLLIYFKKRPLYTIEYYIYTSIQFDYNNLISL